MANAAMLMAMEKGYFKEVGIKVELEDLQSSATAMASLAQGQLNIIAGGVSAGYFNALEKNLPIIITADRVTTPIRHNLMIRPDLKDQIKEIKDLKGKVIASNAPGSISTYEIGKILAKGGLSFADVEVKNLPFPQYAVALTNKAVDAALTIPPFTYNLADKNIALPFAEADDIVQPSPLTIAVNLINTDWAKANQQLVRNYYVALMRGVRDYCQAYHGGSIRKELIDLLVKTETEERPELLHKYPWPARNLERQAQYRQPARRAGLVRAEQFHAREVSGGAAARQQLRRLRQPEARAVRAGEQGQQARRLPVITSPRFGREERIMRMLILLAALAVAGGNTSAAAQQHTVRVGMVRALSATPTMIAIEKGYFKEYGINAEVSDVDTTALIPLAQNVVQVMEAGVTAGYFNALEKNFPITIATDRVASPIGHKLLIRPDLKDKIKTIADLKGKIIATNATASVTNYEIGHILASAGLTLKDIELKVLPFPQMSVGLANKAVDGAIVIPPWVYQVIDQGIGTVLADPDDYVKAVPMNIAVAFINTDWAKQNPDVARNFFVALVRGIRDYCQAYHNGPNRQEIIDIAVRTGVERRQELLHKYPWQARDPNGRFNMASLLDIQSFYVKAGLSQTQFPPERLATREYSDFAAQKLGPFVVENKDSKLPGCR